MKKNILLWGTGSRTAEYLDENFFKDYNIVAIIDTNKKVEIFKDIPVIYPYEISRLEEEISYILITNSFFSEIIESLNDIGVDKDKVIITDAIKYKPYCKYYERIKEPFPEIYEHIKHQAYRVTRENERDVDDKSSIFNGIYDTKEYDWDYFRYRTFELVADEINERKIEGAVAEVGVFQGTFSALINRKFKDKKIYLYDTFEGFDNEEAEKEIRLGRCTDDFIKVHKDTTVKTVLSKLMYPDNAVICKGFFPDTVTLEAENEKYAFVSLDVDFEESTLAGLSFFYPRLSEGGYIFVHDYNTYFLEEIKLAITRYENEIGKKLRVVPLADRAGTIIIIK